MRYTLLPSWTLASEQHSVCIASRQPASHDYDTTYLDCPDLASPYRVAKTSQSSLRAR